MALHKLCSSRDTQEHVNFGRNSSGLQGTGFHYNLSQPFLDVLLLSFNNGIAETWFW